MRTVFALLVDIHTKCILQTPQFHCPRSLSLATFFASTKNNLELVIVSEINHNAPVTILLNEESLLGIMSTRLPLFRSELRSPFLFSKHTHPMLSFCTVSIAMHASPSYRNREEELIAHLPFALNHARKGNRSNTSTSVTPAYILVQVSSIPSFPSSGHTEGSPSRWLQ